MSERPMMRRTAAAAAFAVISSGCAARLPPAGDLPLVGALPPPTEMRQVAGSTSPPFGGEYPGYSYWLSDNGRYALIYQWREDTDLDGTVSISIGIHGEMLDDRPHPYIVDTRTGEAQRYDEFLRAAAGRWIALLEGETIWLLDAESGRRTALGSAELWAGGGTGCAGPREVMFDQTGERVGVIAGQTGSLTVHHLEDGRSREIEAPEGILWRATLADITDVVLLHVVPPDSVDPERDFPQQVPSCSSRLETLFARTYSSQGWTGAVETVVVSPRGARLVLPDPPLVLSAEAVAVGDSLLLTLDGNAIDLPPGCADFWAAQEAPSVIVHCGNQRRLFDPATGRAISLPYQVQPIGGAVGVQDERGDVWLPVLITDSAGSGGQAKRLGRLRIRDGALEIGPSGTSDASIPRHGWVMSTAGDSLYLLEVASGRAVSISGGIEMLHRGIPKSLLARQETLVLDALNARYMKLPNAGPANERGCMVVSDGPPGTGRQHGIENGPWRLRCTGDPPPEGR